MISKINSLGENFLQQKMMGSRSKEILVGAESQTANLPLDLGDLEPLKLDGNNKDNKYIAS